MMGLSGGDEGDPGLLVRPVSDSELHENDILLFLSFRGLS